MASGVVKRVFKDKGFGFIKPDDGSAELFFHRSALKDASFDGLAELQRVTYTVGDSPKGPRAEDVHLR